MKTDWNATLYDDKHHYVSHYGQGMMPLLAPKKNEKILDLGCGTGDLTNELSLQGIDVVGVDRSETMIAKAKTKYPDVHFAVKDILALGYHDTFDAVFSNAVLHWVKQAEQALLQIYRSLRPGGRFVAEFGGENNIQIITDSIRDVKAQFGYHSSTEAFPWYFPSIGQYTSLMERVGFQVVFAEHIDRPTRLEGKGGFRNWLSMFAVSCFTNVKEEDKPLILEIVEKDVEKDLFFFDHWLADYKRIRVKGVKK